jgi:preprotein translocase subunit SecG
MFSLLLSIHVLICICLMIVTLLQRGKGAGMSSVFGGGGTQSMFGGRGAAPMLAKATVVIASLFMVSSLSLSLMSVSTRRVSRSAIQKEMEKGPFAPVDQGVTPLTPVQETPESTGAVK